MADHAKGLKLVHHHHEYFDRYKTAMKYAVDLDDQQQTSRIHTFGNFRTDSELWVLAIGTGNGIKDNVILDALTHHNNRINYVVVDPSEFALQEFKHTSASKQDGGRWNDVSFVFQQTTIEEYLERAKSGKERHQFDIIHAQHCAYYFDDPGGVVSDLAKCLNAGGVLLIAACFGAWERAAEEMMKYFTEPTMSCNGSTALRETLRRQLPGLKFSAVSRKFAIKADECFKEESKEGNHILDFILQTLDVRKRTPKEDFDKIVSFLREQCCYTRDGETYFDGDEEDILISQE